MDAAEIPIHPDEDKELPCLGRLNTVEYNKLISNNPSKTDLGELD